MSKKPFPFKVCELCCSGGDSGGGTGGDIVIDDVMSDTSENPVQNKVIKAYTDEQIIKNRPYYTETIVLFDYTVQSEGDEFFETPNGVNYYDDFKLYVNGIETDMFGDINIKLLIENNTSSAILVQSRDTSVNGFMIDGFLSSEITAGKKVNASLSLWKTYLEP